jgi:hypothetical protein
MTMEMYSVERWILDRHAEAIQGADEQARLEGWPVREQMSHRVAASLRRLADRIDGRKPARIFLHPG